MFIFNNNYGKLNIKPIYKIITKSKD